MFTPQNIGTDLKVDGTILSYSELWFSGTKKLIDSSNDDSLTAVYNFSYKNENYYNTFTKNSSGITLSATIRTGTFDNDDKTAGTLVEEITY